MAYIPETGSVVAFQSDPTKLLTHASVSGMVGVNVISGSVIGIQQGSVGAVIIGGSILTTAPANQSVSGTVGASTVGHVPVVIVGGSVLTSSTPNQSVSGTVQVEPIGTIITSIVNIVPSSVIVGASIFGLAPVNITNANVPIAGSVAAFQAGTQITSLVSTVPSSVIVGISVFGQLPAGTAPLGSVATLQGTNPWVVNFQNSSIITINASSSILAVPVGSTITVFQDSSLLAVPPKSATSSVYEVLSSISTVSILNANVSRKGATIYNNSGTPLYLKLGTAANTSVYTVLMVADAYYEMPFGYTGVVAGITASNAGIINVTELT